MIQKPTSGPISKGMKSFSQRDARTSMVTAALFAIAKICRQPKGAPVDE